MKKKLTDKIYDRLTGNEGKRITTGIREESADSVPENFLRLLAATVFTKTGDALSKPAILITWMLGTLGTPASIIGLIVPVREAGSLILQILVGEAVGRLRIRKWMWVGGSLLQGLSILGMVPVLLLLKGTSAGWFIVGLLAVFSLARGICSVVSKDLVGRTIPKTRRGRLSGIATSIAGTIAIGVGVWLLFHKGDALKPAIFAIILGSAGILWLIAAGVMSFLNEPKAESISKGNPLKEIGSSLALLKTDADFRLFCISRALLSGTVLSMPYYVILAQRATEDSGSGGLGLFLIAGSVATALSGAIWGRFSDVSSRKKLAVAGIFAGAIGISMAAIAGIGLTGLTAVICYGTLFFLLGLAHTGIRLGRKTHLVDMSTAETRASMVAVSNTLIGLVLLGSSAFSLIADAFGVRMIILLFAAFGIAGGLLILKLSEVQDV